VAPSVGPPVTGCGEKRLRIRVAASRHGAQRSVGLARRSRIRVAAGGSFGSARHRRGDLKCGVTPGSTAVDAAFMQLADRPARLCVAHAA
jgi:hypothetical protein